MKGEKVLYSSLKREKHILFQWFPGILRLLREHSKEALIYSKANDPPPFRVEGFLPRKGLQRKSFFTAGGKKDWSGKPGFLRRAAKNAPKKKERNSRLFLLFSMF
ncbi:MAG: hypothetical protein LBI85_08970 [Spirochaetaceae bacterium]|jgi:hypothetical protein|nr:hypothetical protein [Spirochaetaceae bacterium]